MAIDNLDVEELIKCLGAPAEAGVGEGVPPASATDLSSKGSTPKEGGDTHSQESVRHPPFTDVALKIRSTASYIKFISRTAGKGS